MSGKQTCILRNEPELLHTYFKNLRELKYKIYNRFYISPPARVLPFPLMTIRYVFRLSQ